MKYSEDMGSIAKLNIKNNRVMFLPGMQKKYLDNVLNKSRLSMTDLAVLVNVHPRSFRDWRREAARMNLHALEILSEKFGVYPQESKETMTERWKKSQKNANRIGGFATIKKYGSFFTPEGRVKGGLKAISILREKGIISTKHFLKPKYSVKLAEFVGIMLGDGGITSGQFTITLNGEADAEYIPYVSNLIYSLFGEMPKNFKHRYSKAIAIYCSGIELISYFKQLGLKVGNKVKLQVDVPGWVKDDRDYRIACLRGLMDTDGGVFTHRYKVNGKQYSYDQVCFTNSSFPLINFVYKTLLELGFKPKIVGNKKVWLYDQNETLMYNALVGTSNYRLGKFFGEWAGR